jgi:RHS repeat-associated protein
MYDGTVQHAPLTYKFTGKERDSESGLDNFGARYDSSSMGRFMSADPIGGQKIDPQTLNKYRAGGRSFAAGLRLAFARGAPCSSHKGECGLPHSCC